MTGMAVLLVLMVVGGVGAVLLVDALLTRPALGLGLVLGYALVVISFDQGLGTQLGGITFRVSDVIAILVLGAAVLRLLRTSRLSVGQLLLLGLLAVLAVNLTRGVGTFGLQTATNEFREYLRFVGPALYLSTFPAGVVRDLVARWWPVAAGWLVVICLVRWADKLAGIPAGPFALGSRSASNVFGQGDSLRVIHASDTMLLLQAALITTALWFERQGDRRGTFGHLARRSAGWQPPTWVLPALTVTFLLSVLILQHRTVWISTVVATAVAVVLIRDRQLTGRLLALIVAVVLVATVASVLNTGGESLPDPLQDQLVDSATSDNTFVWRFAGWIELATDPDVAVMDRIVGQPFGSGYGRWIDGRYTEVNAHSTYLAVYLRAGLLGLGLLLAAYAWVVAMLRRNRSLRGRLPDLVVLTVLVTLMTFGIAYNPSDEQGLLLGLALCTAAGARAVSDPAAAVPPWIRSRSG